MNVSVSHMALDPGKGSPFNWTEYDCSAPKHGNETVPAKWVTLFTSRKDNQQGFVVHEFHPHCDDCKRQMEADAAS